MTDRFCAFTDPEAAVANDRRQIDDIAGAFLDVQVDPDLNAVTDSEMQQRPVGAVLVYLHRPDCGVDEACPFRKEVPAEYWTEIDVAVIGDSDGIRCHILDQTAVFANDRGAVRHT